MGRRHQKDPDLCIYVSINQSPNRPKTKKEKRNTKSILFKRQVRDSTTQMQKKTLKEISRRNQFQELGKKILLVDLICVQLYWEGLFGGHVFIPKTVKITSLLEKRRDFTPRIWEQGGSWHLLIRVYVLPCMWMNQHSIISETCNLPATSRGVSFSLLFSRRMEEVGTNGRRALYQQK